MPRIKWNSQDFSEFKELKPSQYAKLHNLSAGHVRCLCRKNLIEGAQRVIGKYWIIPRDARIIQTPSK